MEGFFAGFRNCIVIVLPDFKEEGWHSMDLCADMLIKHAPVETELKLSVPRYRKLFGFLPSKNAKNFDRWYNRWMVYPNHVKQLATQPGFFHIVDHSYAHLANVLPEGRVGIYCHDLDAFKCVLTPDREARPNWFVKMMRSVFEGLKKARWIFCSTKITREMLVKLGYWNQESILVVPYGVAEEFQTNGLMEKGEYILHVGSCIPRKRIDVLLEAFSVVSRSHDNLQLIQAGGSFSPEHFRQIRTLGIQGRVEQRQNLTRDDLACLYRGAKCLVVTSDAEGFGLPVIEGLSCGARVVASAIPALQEVGGPEIGYFPPGNPYACAETILEVLDSPVSLPKGVTEKWSWAEHAKKYVMCTNL